jgi:hypothetical protein
MLLQMTDYTQALTELKQGDGDVVVPGNDNNNYYYSNLYLFSYIAYRCENDN